jgi:hypothetical protein
LSFAISSFAGMAAFTRIVIGAIIIFNLQFYKTPFINAWMDAGHNRSGRRLRWKERL